MSDTHSEGIQTTPDHGASHGHGAVSNPFTPTEIARFQREDRYAGGAVVGLMTCIFSIGVVLYTIVLLSVIPG